ncbi:hypothetical protein D3C72_1655780 [compost metagenome]
MHHQIRDWRAWLKYPCCIRIATVVVDADCEDGSSPHRYAIGAERFIDTGRETACAARCRGIDEGSGNFALVARIAHRIKHADIGALKKASPLWSAIAIKIRLLDGNHHGRSPRHGI